MPSGFVHPCSGRLKARAQAPSVGSIGSFVEADRVLEVKAMFALKSAYERCLSRLQKDHLGETLLAGLCVALFLIALTISRLQ
jgi:hypothetical protein